MELLQVVLPHSKGITIALRNDTPLQLCMFVCVCVGWERASADQVLTQRMESYSCLLRLGRGVCAAYVLHTSVHHSNLLLVLVHHQSLTGITQGSKWGTDCGDAWQFAPGAARPVKQLLTADHCELITGAEYCERNRLKAGNVALHLSLEGTTTTSFMQGYVWHIPGCRCVWERERD